LKHNFCPVLVQRGEDKRKFFEDHQGCKDLKKFTECVLQIYNRSGDVVYERNFKNSPLTVTMSRNAPKPGYNTLIYVPAEDDGVDGHTDIHIVTLPLSSTKDADEPKEYRLRDWACLFGKESKDSKASDKDMLKDTNDHITRDNDVAMDAVMKSFGVDHNLAPE
jgi:hypothetical protein